MGKFKLFGEKINKQEEVKKQEDQNSECSINTAELLASCDEEDNDEENQSSPNIRNHFSKLDYDEANENMQSSPNLCDFKFYDDSSCKSNKKKDKFSILTDLKQTLKFVNNKVNEESKIKDNEIENIEGMTKYNNDIKEDIKEDIAPFKSTINKPEIQNKLKLLKSK